MDPGLDRWGRWRPQHNGRPRRRRRRGSPTRRHEGVLRGANGEETRGVPGMESMSKTSGRGVGKHVPELHHAKPSPSVRGRKGHVQLRRRRGRRRRNQGRRTMHAHERCEQEKETKPTDNRDGNRGKPNRQRRGRRRRSQPRNEETVEDTQVLRSTGRLRTAMLPMRWIGTPGQTLHRAREEKTVLLVWEIRTPKSRVSQFPLLSMPSTRTPGQRLPRGQ